MHSDLERLIRLQQIDSTAETARRRIAAIPEQIAALDAQLDGARAAVAAARERKAQNETERRALDKDIAAVRARRSKYSDQTMEVKTNREFHALQHEIEMADQEIARLEEKLLVNMLADDECAAAIKAAEGALKQAERDLVAERQALEREQHDLQASLSGTDEARRSVAADLPAPVLSLYEQLLRTKRGLAVVEAKDGLCTECHVRVRPAVYLEVRRNSQISTCENCHRILYYVPPPAAPAGQP